MILETVDSLRARHAAAFAAFELVSVVVFSVEYLLRLWSCTDHPSFGERLRDRARYAVRPMALIDLVAILPAFVSAGGIDLRFMRSVRLLRLARALKFARYSSALQTVGAVVRAKRDELALTVLLAAILLVTAAGGIYFAENDAQPDKFASIPEAMWWAIATLTTVGYGDVYPVTLMGRIFGGLVAVTGVGLFALPAGILAGGFAEELQRRRRPARTCPHCGQPIDG